MATAESVKAKLQALLDKANGVTGNADTDLTTAVAALMAGFGQGGGGLAYDMGEFVLDEDTTAFAAAAVPHNLGAVPEFILVWTDDFADLTVDNVSPYSNGTNVGYIWLDGLTMMPYQRLSSVASSSCPWNVGFVIPSGDYRLGTFAPTSATYTITGRLPNEKEILLVFYGNSNYYRAGITYKYFVSRAWWNKREE